VQSSEAASYEAYVSNVKALCEELTNARVVMLPERLGFGHAVKHALTMVTTPYVLINQHDQVTNLK
jgi:hypothetical protein